MSENESHKADAALAALVRMFQSGELPAAVNSTLIAKNRQDRPMDSWSLSNQIIAIYFGRTTDARTYKDWQKVGRQVQRGAKAVWILAPVTRTITEEDDNGQKSKRVIVVGFKGTPRFRIEDTDGDPVEYPDYTPPENPPLMGVAERLGVKVTYLPRSAGQDYRGAYMLHDNSIILGTHDVDTFFHELAHAAHASIEKLKSGQNARQEIIAETVAAALCLHYGYEGYVAESFDYVSFYGDGDPGKAVVKLLRDVQKVLDVILSEPEADDPVEMFAEPVPAPYAAVETRTVWREGMDESAVYIEA